MGRRTSVQLDLIESTIFWKPTGPPKVVLKLMQGKLCELLKKIINKKIITD